MTIVRHTLSIRRGVLSLSAVLLAGGCVSQQQLDTMQAQMLRQDQQIQQLSAQLSGVQPAQADTWAQVQSLRQEMGEVRGRIDEFNNAAVDMGGLTGLTTMVRQNRSALKNLETQFAVDLKLDAPASSGTVLPGGSGGAAPTVSAPPATAAEQPAQTAPAAAKDTVSALYDAGIAAFNARNYQGALTSFKDFTATYPKHKLISNAWFWRGECEFALGNHAAAALNYEEVISKYPSSGKIAQAYLKQGMSFARTGKKDAAAFRLNELIKKFPKSAEATRAKQVLKELK